MRIGIDAKNLTGPLSGISRYIASMVEHLAQHNVEIVLFAPCKIQQWRFPHKNISLVEENYSDRFEKFFWSQFVLPRQVSKHQLDVFWGPAHRLSPFLPQQLPKMLTIHDLVWQENPETMTFLGLWGERLLMPGAIANANRIITPSNCTAEKVERAYKVARGKTQYLYPGTTPKTAHADKPSAGNPFALFVGTKEPRKNLSRLIEAYCKLPDELRQDCRLKIVGAKGWKLEDLQSSLDTQSIDILGFVSDEELEQLYHDCEFLVLPSLSEGFGLPIIEAQKYAKPVLTSNCSALPEVAKDGALYIDPLDVDSIKDGLQKLMTDNELRANLSMGALQNVERFSWAKAAEQFLEIAYSMQGPAGQHAKGSAFLQNA